MEIDISAYIKGAKRQISSRDYEGKAARVLTISRSYATDPEDLWDALTNPQRIPKWFLPVSGELAVGGQYQLVGNASGKILACDRPRQFDITWEYGDQVSWVKVMLTAAGDKTNLLLEHIAHVPPELWDTYGPGAVGVGWDLGLYGLYRHLATGQALDPTEGMMWPTTEPGKQFVALSSGAWADASIADGTPEDSARPAAERTTAFYTDPNGSCEQK